MPGPRLKQEERDEVVTEAGRKSARIQEGQREEVTDEVKDMKKITMSV